MSEQQKTHPMRQMPKLLFPLQEVSDPLNPFDFFKEMRETTPIRYNEFRECWDLFKYDDIHRVLQDPSVFSSRFIEEAAQERDDSLISMDPPRHTQFRNLVNKAFTPKKIQDLAPMIESISHELIDDVQASGRMEIVNDFSSPLPVIVIASLLGIPASDRMKFKEWSDIAIAGVDTKNNQSAEELMQQKEGARAELAEYFGKIIAARREEPQDDLITALIAAEVDAVPLTDNEILNFCFLLLVAGNETTTNLINNAMWHFIRHPELQAQLRENPELIPLAVEEVLRFVPPVQMIIRKAAQDVQIGPAEIKKGDILSLWLASANRDEDRFEKADTFVIDRHPNAHMTFGFGIHFCLGAPLARLEAQIALKALLTRLSNWQHTEDNEMLSIPGPIVYGLKKQHVTFRA